MKKIAVVYSDYYKDVIDGLLEKFKEANQKYGYEVDYYRVTGSLEIIFKVASLTKTNPEYAGYVVYGCVIEGKTYHNHVIQDNVYEKLLQVSLDSMRPIGFGVLTVKSYEQALERSVGIKGRGAEALEGLHSLLI